MPSKRCLTIGINANPVRRLLGILPIRRSNTMPIKPIDGLMVSLRQGDVLEVPMTYVQLPLYTWLASVISTIKPLMIDEA